MYTVRAVKVDKDDRVVHAMLSGLLCFSVCYVFRLLPVRYRCSTVSIDWNLIVMYATQLFFRGICVYDMV